MSVGMTDPTTIVLFGATGDLSRRKLLPGLLHLHDTGLLGDFRIVGTATDDLDRDGFLDLAEKAILDLRGPVLRVTGYDVPYPYWKIEDAYMPSVERVVDAARRLLEF